MLDVASLLFGLLLPCLAGWFLMAAVVDETFAGYRWFCVGVGGIAGLFAACALAYLWGRAGLYFHRGWMLGIWIVLAVIAFWRLRSVRRQSAPMTGDRAGLLALLFACSLLVLSVLHFIPLAVEVLHRPVYPFDALTAWATKARVWAESGHWVTFADKEVWLQDTTGALYTDHRPGYPIIVPLLQLWAATLWGSWHSALVNTPWLLFYCFGLMTFFGAARGLGVTVHSAASFTFLMASLPLLNTHVALAGYADLIMGDTFLLAFALLALWLQQRRRWQLTLCLLFVAICPLVKNEGLFWGLALLAAAALSRFRLRTAIIAVAAGSLLALLVLMVFPRNVVVAGHTLAELELGFYPEAFLPMLRSMFLSNSWHLAYVVVLAALFPWRTLDSDLRDRLWPLCLALLIAHGLFATLFLATGYAGGAVRMTAVSRINLALIPSALFFAALVFGLAERAAPKPKPVREPLKLP
jgi:hypothetical protein